MRVLAIRAALLLSLAFLPAAAEAPLLYELPLAPGQRIGYTIDFEVSYPGPLVVNAEWPGLRVLSFKLEELGQTAKPFRLSGPSPQRFTVEVPNPGDSPRSYRLTIQGLPHRYGGAGSLTVERPQAPPPPPPLLEDLPPASPPEVPHTDLPADAPESWRRFSDATDRFADAVERDARGDSCRWQAGLAEWLAERRDALLQHEPAPARDTLEALAEVVEIVRRVDEMRTSDDPALIGPPPVEPEALRRWTRVRDDRIQTVETELDSLLSAIERGHAPQLERQPWPYRLVSCVVGCQRHFEERARVGEQRAVNLDLARTQWDRLLEAADLIEALTRISGGPAPAP